MTSTQRKEGNMLNLTIAFLLIITPKSKKNFTILKKYYKE